MGEAWAALLGAIIGGALSLVGAMGVAWYQAKREERRLGRDRLRENTYALQDTIHMVFQQYAEALEARWERQESRLTPNPDMVAVIFALNMQSIRVGDDMLAGYLGPVLGKLKEARRASDKTEAFQAFNDALDLVSPLLTRMGELLHTDAEIDLGI